MATSGCVGEAYAAPRTAARARGSCASPKGLLHPRLSQPEQCSSTPKDAKHAKELPVFKALTRKNLETRPGRFRSGSSSEVMRVGESLRARFPGCRRHIRV